MDLGLKDKTALILAGGGGLGRAIAKALAAEGAKVAVAGIGAKSIAGTEAELATLGGKSIGLIWDLSDLAQIDGHISKIERELGPVDILVNNTGGPPPTSASGQDPAVWSRYFQTMVLSVIAITDRVLPNMRARHWGRIITSTSSGVESPIPNLAISNTLRISLLGWSKSLAREVAKDGITANIIVPGRIATDRTQFLDEAKAKREGRSAEDVSAESAGNIPAGRYGKPEEYGDVVAFLSSERAA
jgi:3-oxoacyl-[acyl-carrier protein] reductase